MLSLNYRFSYHVIPCLTQLAAEQKVYALTFHCPNGSAASRCADALRYERRTRAPQHRSQSAAHLRSTVPKNARLIHESRLAPSGSLLKPKPSARAWFHNCLSTVCYFARIRIETCRHWRSAHTHLPIWLLSSVSVIVCVISELLVHFQAVPEFQQFHMIWVEDKYTRLKDKIHIPTK